MHGHMNVKFYKMSVSVSSRKILQDECECVFT
jgi:hypothetical protein